MRRLPIFAAAASLLAGTTAIAGEPGSRYQLDVSVVRSNVEIASITTQIMEDVPTTASMNAGGMTYEFEANLFTVQGDGDAAQLRLEAHLSRGDEEIAAPKLTLHRGSPARVQVGDERGDVMNMTISPIP
jgi:hypothetical protein